MIHGIYTEGMYGNYTINYYFDNEIKVRDGDAFYTKIEINWKIK